MTHHEHEQGEIVAATPAGGLVVPDRPIILYIEGDGTGPDIWQATRPVLDAAVAKAYGDSQAHLLAGSPGRGKGLQNEPQLFAGGDPDGPPGISGGPQRTPHHPHRRGVSVPERHAAPGFGPVCLHPPGALLYRGAQPHEGTGKNRHGDFPGKHRRRLCRHRVGRQYPRGPAPHQFSQS